MLHLRYFLQWLKRSEYSLGAQENTENRPPLATSIVVQELGMRKHRAVEKSEVRRFLYVEQQIDAFLLVAH